MLKPFCFGIVVGIALLGVSATAGTSAPAHIDTSGVNMQPVYPASAIPQREAGKIVMQVGVSELGKVTSLGMVQSSGYDDLDTAAMNTARTWHYIPATSDGFAYDSTIMVQIVFKAPDDNAPAAATK